MTRPSPRHWHRTLLDWCRTLLGRGTRAPAKGAQLGAFGFDKSATHEVLSIFARDIEDAERVAGRPIECAWRCHVTGRVIDRAELVALGNQQMVNPPLGLYRWGDLMAHSHPDGGSMPSAADLGVAASWALAGVGMMVVGLQRDPVKGTRWIRGLVIVPPAPPLPAAVRVIRAWRRLWIEAWHHG